MTTQAVKASSEISGRQVLLSLVLFFSFVAAANGAFIYLALSTYTGVVANEPYRKGLKYNERIAAYEQQTELGWSRKLALGDDRRTLTLTLQDKDGAPVTGLGVAAKIGRPATAVSDQALELTETAAGRYEASLASLAPGSWIVDLDASRGREGESQVLYRLRERLWLKP